MSALGQKRTLFMLPLYVCFAPESGHLNVCAAGRIYEHTPSLREGSHRPVCRASRINIIFNSRSFQNSLYCLGRCGVSAFDKMPVSVECDTRLAVP
jgi:hypothetical protein